MSSYLNDSITIDEAVRRPARRTSQTSRTASYTNTDSSLSRFVEMREVVQPVTGDSFSSARSSDSNKQKTRRREQRSHSKNGSYQRSDDSSLQSTLNKRRLLMDQSICQDLKKSSRTLVKHSSAGSLPEGWSSGDLSGRLDMDENVDTKFKSRRKLKMLMQNIEMEKKKDSMVKTSIHQSKRPVSLQVGELGNPLGEWKKPDLENTLSKEAPMRRFRLMCGEVIEDPRVQMFIIILILINAITMGVATFDFVTNDKSTKQAFDIADRLFLTIFTIESTLQLIYRGPSLFTDRWLVFDFGIVVISWTLESLQIIRAFRVFRVFRLVTRLVALRSLLMALGEVLPRIYAIISMLVLVFYIYAVLFIQLFGDLELSEDYFDSLPNALLTCMQFMTLEWAEPAREVMDYYEWAGMIFCSFISITGFIVFNLIVAVVCDAVSIIDKKIRKEEKEYLEEMRRQERESGIDMNESEGLTSQQKWMEAQKRINELTMELEAMKENQRKLIASITKLTNVWQGQPTLELERKRQGIIKQARGFHKFCF